MKLLQILIVLIAIGSTSFAVSDDFVRCGCWGSPKPLGSLLHDADAVALVKWVHGSSPDELVPAYTQFEIVDLHRDVSSSLKDSTPIKIPRFIEGGFGDVYLLVGANRNGWTWHAIPMSAEAYRYHCDVPAFDVDSTEQLRYYVQFLDHSDFTIAEDAWLAITTADLEDVILVAREMDPEVVRSWVLDEEMDASRRGMAGMFLGYCGNGDDDQPLEELILQPTEDVRLELKGVMIGYLLLAGKEGLELIEREILENHEDRVPFIEVYSAMQAVQYLGEHDQAVIPKDRLATTMRLSLVRPEIAEFAVSTLARWADWTIVDQLYAMYGAEGFTEPAMKRSIIRYFLHAQHAGSIAASEGESLPEYARKATEYLEEIKGRDPEILASAYRYLRLPRVPRM